MDDDELYRAPPGEVLIHMSHPGRPIHAETNPCPEGRGLYVLDWADVRNVVYSCQQGDGDGGASHCNGERPTRRAKQRVERVLPSRRMPVHRILELMRVLVDAESDAFQTRIEGVKQTAARLRTVAQEYPGGLAALERIEGHLMALVVPK